MKKIFSKVSYNEDELLESNINSLEIEYYKIKEKNKNLFGIGIIENVNGENSEIKDILGITEDESIIDNILEMFSKNKVTPIISEDILQDFFHTL